MKKIITTVLFISVIISSCTNKNTYKVSSDVPNLVMPNNGLKFKEISNYKNYKIIGTHFRTDKKELRYILANDIAFKAYNEKQVFPEGSKIVKIGWNVAEMSNFEPALEAKKIQRIEYMIKNSKKFSDNPGNWGYARFVKENNTYKSWDQGTASCISCHNLAKNNDYLFTRLQELQ